MPYSIGRAVTEQLGLKGVEEYTFPLNREVTCVHRRAQELKAAVFEDRAGKGFGVWGRVKGNGG